MSLESLAIALHHSRATGTTKLVLIGIANHDGDGGSWPAVATLARYANVDKRTVQRSLDALERLGEVRRIKGQGGDHSSADYRRPNLYRFLLRCPEDCDRTSQHKTARARAVMLPEQLSTGVTPVSPHDAGVRGRGDASVTLTIPLTQDSPVLKTAIDAREENEDALSRGDHHDAVSEAAQKFDAAILAKCPYRKSGSPHRYTGPDQTCAFCGIREDQFWRGKEIRNRDEIGATA